MSYVHSGLLKLAGVLPEDWPLFAFHLNSADAQADPSPSQEPF